LAEFGYEKLDAWKHGMELVASVYLATSTFPKSEQFGLTSQLRRAAVSVPANIAEGYGRGTRPMLAHHSRIALGSLFELRTELEIAVRTGIAAGEEIDVLLSQAVRLSRIFDGFIRSMDS
jgi:four helix bundle protein